MKRFQVELYRIDIVDISEEQAEQIALQFMEHVKEGQWVDSKGVLTEEHVTSHRFDAPADNQDPKRIALVKAMQEAQAHIKDRRNKLKKERS
jgi:hypothetical protein